MKYKWYRTHYILEIPFRMVSARDTCVSYRCSLVILYWWILVAKNFKLNVWGPISPWEMLTSPWYVSAGECRLLINWHKILNCLTCFFCWNLDFINYLAPPLSKWDDCTIYDWYHTHITYWQGNLGWCLCLLETLLFNMLNLTWAYIGEF